jgi:hypothetical protein
MNIFGSFFLCFLCCYSLQYENHDGGTNENVNENPGPEVEARFKFVSDVCVGGGGNDAGASANRDQREWKRR